jgi:hypothetical protein
MSYLRLWIILTITTLSCNNKGDDIIERKLTECYQEKFYDEEGNLTDAIKFYEKFENYLIESKYLKGRTKRDYSELWDNIHDSTKVIFIKEFAKSNGPTVMTMNLSRSRYCFYNLAKEQRIDDSQIKVQLELVEQMDKIGDNGDIELNKRLIQTIDERRFAKIVFRIPTLTYMYLRIEAINWEKYGAKYGR